jgi:hypothetical protein
MRACAHMRTGRAESRARAGRANTVKPGIRPYLVHLYLFSANKRPATGRRETAEELDQSPALLLLSYFLPPTRNWLNQFNSPGQSFPLCRTGRAKFFEQITAGSGQILSMNDSSYGRNSIFRALFGVYIAAARAPPSKSIFACARRVTCTSAISPLLSLRSSVLFPFPLSLSLSLSLFFFYIYSGGLASCALLAARAPVRPLRRRIRVSEKRRIYGVSIK